MNGEYFLIYTLNEGGVFHARVSSVAEYNDAAANRRIDATPADVDQEKRQYLVPALVALAKVEKHHDFILADLTGIGDRTKKVKVPA